MSHAVPRTLTVAADSDAFARESSTATRCDGRLLSLAALATASYVSAVMASRSSSGKSGTAPARSVTRV